MAVPSSSPLRTKSSAKEPEVAAEEVVERDEEVVNNGEVAGRGEENQRKRSKDPGVRVIGGRIYCPVNGKTCHQCRQKTLDFAAECKNMKKLKQCTIKFCQKCLKNRYGEKASEVAQSGDWHCPKCRGICNCSFCMKKRGHQPTGILVHTAKKTGFSSVSEMLNLGNPSNAEKDADQSENKPPASNKLAGFSPSKLGKENSFDKEIDTTGSNVKSPVKSLKYGKSEGLKEICNGNKVDDASDKEKPLKNVGVPEKQPDEEVTGRDEKGQKVRTKRKLHDLKNSSAKDEDDQELPVEVPLPPLPQGTPLTSVAGVDLPVDAVGEALQFLEFCAAFDKVLDMRKGQAESLLRELVSSRRRRTGQASVIVRFHIQLLSFIQEGLEEESSSCSPSNGNDWLKALGEFASESESALGEFPVDCFDGGAEGYDNLDILKKLRLLNVLCDEVLSTEPFRTWIEEQNTKYIEDGKEAKEKILAAKSKEKLLKQKLQNELAEAILAKNGVPLSMSEHDAIVLQVKNELALARADVLLTVGKTSSSNKRKRCDAVRTDPFFMDLDGHAFWKLKTSCGESDILLQEFGSCNSDGSGEKWFIYEPEKKEAVDAYISSVTLARRRRVRASHHFASDSKDQDEVMA